ncbi:hypothetical protein KY314_05130 [Candidatus Woesearchaeota archaeon]|nr:hypothetical protein [Candidatus Woesearchaeota archaeon]
MKIKICPKCGKKLKKIMVSVEGAKNKALSYQCTTRGCYYFDFDKKSSQKVIEELKQNPLKIKQKIVKLSGSRLGMYFNKHIVNSLNMKKGEEIKVSVPDKKHILIELG